MTIPAHPVFIDMPDAFLDALGEEGELTIGGVGLPAPVRAVVRGPFGEVVAGGGFGEPGVNGMSPKVSFVEADVPGLKDGDRFIFKGVAWIVREPMPDGRGIVRCELERA